MLNDWDDFDNPARCNKRKRDSKPENEKTESHKEAKTSASCDWGFGRQFNQVSDEESNDLKTDTELSSDSHKFTPVYEKYLGNRTSINDLKTKNLHKYQNNPEKTLKVWFDKEGHDFSFKTEQPNDNQYVCTIDIPLDDQDFTISSEVHINKLDAVEQICLTACRLLDECGLLYSWQSTTDNKRQQDEDQEEDARDLLEKKRLVMEANKEDDIELDSTSLKRNGDSNLTPDSIGSNSGSSINTYESLMAKWNELNMLILQLKAQLVKLDLGVVQKRQQQQLSSSNKAVLGKELKNNCNNDDNDHAEIVNANVDDEIDPLDEYMSTLNTKTKLSMDEKIEKSRIKWQIVSYEREQSEVSRLIELAKPKFNFNKACPPKSKRM